jgi:hypothetical protein
MLAVGIKKDRVREALCKSGLHAGDGGGSFALIFCEADHMEQRM